MWRCLILFSLASFHVVANQQLPEGNTHTQDSLRHIIRFSDNDTLRAQAFLGLGRLSQISNPDRSIYFYQRSIDVSQMLLYGNSPLPIRRSAALSLAGAMNNLSLIYRSKGDVEKELEYSFGALRIKQQIGDESTIASSLYNISTSFLTLRDTNRSLDYLKRGIYFFQKSENEKGLAYSYFRMGKIEMSRRDTSTALSYYNKALEIETRLNDDYGKSSTLNALASYYASTGKLEQAFKMARDALRINQELDNKTGLLSALYNLGLIEMKRGNLVSASRYTSRGLNIASAIGYIREMEEGYELMAKIAEAQNDYEQAYTFYNQYRSVHDSLIQNQAKKDAVQKGIRDDFKAQAFYDAIARDKQLQIKQQQTENRRTLAWSTGIVLLMFLGMTLWVKSRLKIINQQKTIIEVQNTKIVEGVGYSTEILKSLLPDKRRLQKIFKDAFVVHRPTRIVMGDFHWSKKFENHQVIVCVDTQGKGVPGGFISTVGSLLLDKIIQEKMVDPAMVIRKLRMEFNAVITHEDFSEVDEMDVTVCVIYADERKVDFAGNRNGLIVISDGKGVRYPTEKAEEIVSRSGKANVYREEFTIGNADWLFLYSDGYVKQQGGKSGEEMGYARFIDMLRDCSLRSAAEDKSVVMNKLFDEWQSDNEQSDDAMIVGFQV